MPERTAVEFLSLLDRGEITSESLTGQFLQAIRDRDPKVRAFLQVDEARALEQARSVDAKRKRGEPTGPLAGLPIAVKDVLCTAGRPTTCGSKILQNFVPPYDAHVITRLKQADAVLLGKTNLDEFAMGSSTENSAYQVTRNPWDRERIPGGSSGGSAAAVAACEAPLALGSDTGGSVRQPADQGATIKEVSLPHSPSAVATYYLVATAEASSNLARYDGVHYGHRAAEYDGLIDMYCRTRGEGFGAEVKRRVMLGTYALSSGYIDAYYLKALKVRRLIRQDFDQAFAQCDVVMGPTSPTPAFKIGEKADDPLAMYLSDIYTISANLAGIPGISIPCGFTKAGLPIGLQILAAPFAEEKLLRVARMYERETEWHKRRPVV